MHRLLRTWRSTKNDRPSGWPIAQVYFERQARRGTPRWWLDTILTGTTTVRGSLLWSDALRRRLWDAYFLRSSHTALKLGSVAISLRTKHRRNAEACSVGCDAYCAVLVGAVQRCSETL